ncbi:MAG: DUF1641 domain-containing protein [Desulfurococcales archaeon]|nr:DUF1641 domain-containing protein [Desulfurococcales archaeon]
MSSSGGGGLEELARILSEPGAAEALEKLVRVAVKLDEAGVLDLLEALADGRLIREFLEAALSGGAIRVLDQLNDIVKEIGEVADAIVAEPRPVGLSGLLRALRDPEVQRGLGRLIALLRALGRVRLGGRGAST